MSSVGSLDEAELLTIDEVARMLRTQPKTLYNWRHNGLFPLGFKVGGRVLYSRSDIHAYIEAHREVAPEQILPTANFSKRKGSPNGKPKRDLGVNRELSDARPTTGAAKPARQEGLEKTKRTGHIAATKGKATP